MKKINEELYLKLDGLLRDFRISNIIQREQMLRLLHEFIEGMVDEIGD